MLFGQRNRISWVTDRLEAEIISLVAQELMMHEAKIHISDRFGDDLGVASLDYVDLELAIQQRFKVSVEDLLISEELKTIHDLAQYLRPRLSPERASDV